MAKAASKRTEKTKKKSKEEKKQVKKTGAASAKKARSKVQPVKVEAKTVPLENPTIYELLHQIAGEHGYTVAKAIVSEELTDEEIAKRTGIRLNLVRRILYDLYDNRVVSYRRVRDENSGWYIYYWKVDPERALAYVKTNRQLLLQRLEEQLEKEKNTIYFSCSNGCPKVTLEEASENDFKCPKCKGKLEPYDNSAIIVSLERRIQALREQLTQA
ncbi:MAG: transcription factor E [Candidatus Hadarchaeum sp.]|uniref:transcription factor E n=1 Tax=Candidatus Hadarchaeum sp. TaxID=2883567 RepID=UPI003D0AF4F8